MNNSEHDGWELVAPPVRRRVDPAPVQLVVAPRVCRYCGSRAFPDVVSKVSQAGWVMFYLSLFSLIGIMMCWIPLVFMREEVIYCYKCETRLN